MVSINTSKVPISIHKEGSKANWKNVFKTILFFLSVLSTGINSQRSAQHRVLTDHKLFQEHKLHRNWNVTRKTLRVRLGNWGWVRSHENPVGIASPSKRSDVEPAEKWIRSWSAPTRSSNRSQSSFKSPASRLPSRSWAAAQYFIPFHWPRLTETFISILKYCKHRVFLQETAVNNYNTSLFCLAPKRTQLAPSIRFVSLTHTQFPFVRDPPQVTALKFHTLTLQH